ncbi:MAG: undecaprenyldiphospho-muramoylpentapeptide beta-N-acetylglucosaminyltransferase [Coriobacteriales bacterium]|jgi:UDP-N-acetylglucosamine--N-acetylmuramyl-(pentapeptide) pyrophosphoryl-undecaprenol N-acetylglucosamine transferase|nr:undecaprenyldiphospho-muramoylpentapeptide beta-N-acetylglucosaminyltransferase [Coriobacteriales bacterium]
MRAVITGGGTAGHINPALAIAQELRSLGHEVSYAGTPGGLEARLVPQEGFSFAAFDAAGFNRRKPLTLLSSSAKIVASALRARRWLAGLAPQVVVGFGGYVSIPVGLAASWLKIPLVIHEQNATSGMANRFLARRARLAALAYASAAEDFKAAGRVEVVGNPVRASLFATGRAEAREAFGLPADATVLLAFGGSLGAQHLNEALVSQAATLLSLSGLHILHVTGTRDYEGVAAAIERLPQAAGRWHLIGYCDRMGEVYAAANAVLSRAGATTLAELSALGMPALLVPYPHAAANEQATNARSLVEAGAAAMVADSDLDTPAFIEQLTRLLTNEEYRATMAQAARSHGNPHARESLARIIVELAAAPSPA